MRIFSLDLRQELAMQIGNRLGIDLAPFEIRSFDDGEHKIRPLTNVNGEDVFILNSLTNEPSRNLHEKLCLLLFFVGTLRDAMAKSVTVVTPYLCYARKDQRTKTRDPVTLKYLATLLEAVGVSQIVAVDVHNRAAFESAFRIPTAHISARELLCSCLAEQVGKQPLLVLSPDLGGVKRAESFRKMLDKLRQSEASTLGFLEKERSEGKLTTGKIVGVAKEQTVVIVDDLISSGETVANAAKACKAAGAKKVLVAATHAVFTSKSAEHLSSDAIDAIFITNTVQTEDTIQQRLRHKITVLDSSRICAKAIEAIHSLETIVEHSHPT